MTETGLFTVQDYPVRVLQVEELASIQDLYEKCMDYFEMLTGLPPNPSDTSSLFTDVPEGKSVQDKCLLGLYSPQDGLIGILDAVRDHPKQDDWWLGLLLIDPVYRGKGLGRDLYSAFEDWITKQGAQYVYLGVVESNGRAFHFWQIMEFEIVTIRPPKKFGALNQTINVMRRTISKE